MADDALHVELVSAERKVWSGDATLVTAKTTEGEIGIMRLHEPLLGILTDGAVRIKGVDGETVVAAVHGGFLSVAENKVSVLAEVAELAGEIDVARAQAALDNASDDLDSRLRAEVRLNVAGDR